jgi:exosortase
VALVLTLAGLCLLLGGPAVLRWAWPALLFLLFMLPLPFNVERLLALELRKVATFVSTYALQTLGFTAVADGNRILLDTVPIDVAEVCSGLSMLMTFVALSVACVFVFELPVLDRILILLSALPIAVLANAARIVVTAFLMEQWDPEKGYRFFHDYAGWLMMVFALVLLYLEVVVLRLLLVPVPPLTRPPTQPVPVICSQESGVRSQEPGVSEKSLLPDS